MTKRLRLGLVMLASSMSAFASGDVVVEQMQNATVELIQVLKQDEAELRANPKLIYDAAKPVVQQHFDMPGVARLVLGKHYRRMTKTQRSEFVLEFEKLLIRIYGMAMLNNLGNDIRWERKKGGDDKFVTVRAHTMYQGNPVEIDFNMRTSKSYKGFKVYNVKVKGISLVTNYRTTFNRIIAANGYGALLDELRRKNGGS